MTGISLESVYNCSSQIPTRDIDGFRKDGKLLRLLQRGLPGAAGLKRKHAENSFAWWAITLPAGYVELCVCVSQIVSFSVKSKLRGDRNYTARCERADLKIAV